MANNALFEPAFGSQVGGPDNRLLAAPPTAADAYQFDADAAARSLRGAWAAAQDPQTWQDAAQQWGNAMIAGTSAPGFRAYHGSPHAFERFDASKIGTGEGAQAYGHGLYLADEEAVARQYRQDQPTFGGGPYNSADPAHRAAFYLDQNGGDRAATLKAIDAEDAKMAARPDFYAEGRARLAEMRPLVADPSAKLPEVKSKGHLYEVQVNADPAHFLDWDKPLAEQSPHVQQALEKLGVPNYRHVTGELAYAHLAGDHVVAGGQPGVPAQAAATDVLKSAGIPGIRYLDGGSRANGEGTSNHVIFDPATIEILRKYGIAGLMAGGAAAASGQSEQ